MYLFDDKKNLHPFAHCICSTMISRLHNILTRFRNLSPGFENNHTLKCCSDNFPTLPYISGCMKNVGPTFQCIVLLQSRGQGPKNIENYGTNLSPTFNKNKDLVPWIGEQRYLKTLVHHFSIDRDMYGYVGKLTKQNFNVRLCPNPGNKFLILVKIL